ncbi:MAG TPA: 5-formyltetrahydrofolate cyclo-ligase [Amaricoccus sp.]|nr:5-formyltetrahydrofolate cyclo-ligase [Amaricoccus sp.]
MTDAPTEGAPEGASDKAAARQAAFAVRAAAHAAGAGAARLAAGHVRELFGSLRGVRTVAGYLPIRSEIDARPAMLALAGLGYGIAVPVIEGPGRPLAFRSWTPGVATERGPYGVRVPVTGEPAEPDALLVPLLAFDAAGHRLGYGGGFYDRTIAALRAGRGVVALGLAYAAQEVAEVPRSATDMRLDAVVTDAGVRWTGGAA